ncbi:hypothetical protein WJX74_003332 [Apatococcus lobatus]|uniref:BRCA2 OB1 domain-containing protein n=1 Tax=Apatococcus lobatus TaxID=904363 RepID=A0AAW1RBW1_9CHLO
MHRPVRTFALEATQGGWQVQERHNASSGIQIDHSLGSGVFSSVLQPLALQGPHENQSVHDNGIADQPCPQLQAAACNISTLGDWPTCAASPPPQRAVTGIYGTEQLGQAGQGEPTPHRPFQYDLSMSPSQSQHVMTGAAQHWNPGAQALPNDCSVQRPAREHGKGVRPGLLAEIAADLGVSKPAQLPRCRPFVAHRPKHSSAASLRLNRGHHPEDADAAMQPKQQVPGCVPGPLTDGGRQALVQRVSGRFHGSGALNVASGASVTGGSRQPVRPEDDAQDTPDVASGNFVTAGSRQPFGHGASKINDENNFLDVASRACATIGSRQPIRQEQVGLEDAGSMPHAVPGAFVTAASRQPFKQGTPGLDAAKSPRDGALGTLASAGRRHGHSQTYHVDCAPDVAPGAFVTAGSRQPFGGQRQHGPRGRPVMQPPAGAASRKEFLASFATDLLDLQHADAHTASISHAADQAEAMCNLAEDQATFRPADAQGLAARALLSDEPATLNALPATGEQWSPSEQEELWHTGYNAGQMQHLDTLSVSMPASVHDHGERHTAASPPSALGIGQSPGLRDISNEPQRLPDHRSRQIPGLQTAAGQPISIPAARLDKAHLLLKEAAPGPDHKHHAPNLHQQNSEANGVPHPEFHAGGMSMAHSISIAADKLESTHAILQEPTTNVPADDQPGTADELSSLASAPRLQMSVLQDTNRQPISKDAAKLDSACAFLGDPVSVYSNADRSDASAEPHSLTSAPRVHIPGLQTANRQEICMDAAKLHDAQSFMQEPAACRLPQHPPSADNQARDALPMLQIPGLRTAGGQHISIDAAKLRNAQAFLEKNPAAEEVGCAQPQVRQVMHPAAQMQIPGLQTAGGRSIAIDSARLSTARAFLQDLAVSEGAVHAEASATPPLNQEGGPAVATSGAVPDNAIGVSLQQQPSSAGAATGLPVAQRAVVTTHQPSSFALPSVDSRDSNISGQFETPKRRMTSQKHAQTPDTLDSTGQDSPGQEGPKMAVTEPAPRRMQRRSGRSRLATSIPASAAGKALKVADGPSSFKLPRRSKFKTPMRKLAIQKGAIADTATPGADDPAAAPRDSLTKEQQGASASRRHLHDLTGSLLKQRCKGQDCLPVTSWPALPDATSNDGKLDLRVPAGKEAGEGGVLLRAADFFKMLHEAGAGPQNASMPWVENHLQWICWKLAALEAHLPRLQSQLLTADVVLDELKLRYEREVNQGQSPWLKRVLEQDVPASHAMVLRVARILLPPPDQQSAAQGPQKPQLQLTDGWYGVRANLDAPLTGLVQSGHISVGCKLRICGAELQGQQQEVLLAAKSSSLTLHANGVKRARLTAKLGQQSHRSIHLPLNAIHPAGGAVPQTDVVIQRKGPVLMWARAPDGIPYTTSQKGHAHLLKQHEAQLCKVSDAVAAELQGEEAARCRQALTPLGKRKAAAGEQLYAQALLSEGSFNGHGLTEQQQHQLASFSAKRKTDMETRQQKLMAERLGEAVQAEGTPVLRLLVSPVIHKDVHRNEDVHAPWAVIRVWRPSDDVLQLAEGEVYSVAGLSPAERSGRGATPLELSTSRITAWARLQPGRDSCLLWAFQPRAWLSLEQVLQQQPGSLVDCFGLAVSATAVQHPNQHAAQQFVFLVDSTLRCADKHCSREDGWIIGVRLTKTGDTMGFLDPQDQLPAFCWFRTLQLKQFDERNRICVMDVDAMTSAGVNQPPARDHSLNVHCAQELLTWSQSNVELVQQLQRRIANL